MLSLVAILFITNALLKPKLPPSTSPTPATTGASSYRNLIPGASTQDQVNELLGFPLKEEDNAGTKLAEYESTNRFRNHIVEFEGGKVSLVKEIVNTVDNKNSDVVTSIYGPAPYILYNQYPMETFHLYVYPQNGIAYLGHEDKTILEIWYFEPTTIETFRSRWGEGYGTNKPTGPTKGY